MLGACRYSPTVAVDHHSLAAGGQSTNSIIAKAVVRRIDFILFFSVVFSIYGLMCFYIYRKGLAVLPPIAEIRWTYTVLFLIVVLAFLAGRMLERVSLSWFSSLLVWVGSFWFGAMVYLILSLLLWDGVHLLLSLAPGGGVRIVELLSIPRWAAGIGLLVLVGGVVGWGYVNAMHPRIKEISIRMPKSIDGASSLRVVMASDIHLGTIISHERLKRIVNAINGLRPDVILLPGDILDEDLGPVVRHNLGELLCNLRATYGVYGATGNHEYIGGAEEACRYLEDHGIVMLRDSVVVLPVGVVVVGREDRSIGQFAGQSRKSLSQILEKVDRTRPIIVMDHQPSGLQEAALAGIDLQISGHTHNGQLWPFNYIADAVYECSWGYHKKGQTQYYVSCGVGTWGPPVRVGNTPEIMVMTLSFGSDLPSGGTPDSVGGKDAE